MLVSSGTLLYTTANGKLEVLLVHPSGNYNRHAFWTIPKGVAEAGEDLMATARRETFEETGIKPTSLTSLGSIVYHKTPKRVHCFAGPLPEGAVPRCASWEVDQVMVVPFEEARGILHPDQLPFLERLGAALADTDQGHLG